MVVIVFSDPFWLMVSKGLLLSALSRFVPGDEYVNEETVENAYEDQAFDNPENLAGKMTIPSKSLLSLLARCSLFFYAYAAIPTTGYIMPPILPCQPLTIHVLANR